MTNSELLDMLYAIRNKLENMLEEIGDLIEALEGKENEDEVETAGE